MGATAFCYWRFGNCDFPKSFGTSFEVIVSSQIWRLKTQFNPFYI
uniref:Uncharacterized protein n=1 Tax=Leptospira santarosai serovar Arenal str. MAVJ 401 TaxID=1049976 RepID=M6JLW2_9LEPT|nr:hypothetical protein LEP1GSC063_1849 [Leptospira santarosai serovar Arenal str. MAVJ 401]